MKREETRLVKVGNLTIGHSNEVVIQSMSSFKTSKVKKVVKEINELTPLGLQLMRISIIDNNDIKAIKKIKSQINIPLVADIHYSLDYAFKAIKEGVDAIRINPGNTNPLKLKELLNLAKNNNVAIRIGINRGSIKIDENKDIPLQLIEKMSEYVSFFEQNGFYNTVLSIKDSDPLITLKTYELLSETFSYPLHIGVTESGINEIGTIRSSAILAPLLLKGIGSTIRISLTSPRINEIKACKRLLHDLNLYPNYPTLISCPLCGRSMVKSNKELATKVLKYLEDNNINIKVAIMGCVINGITEGKNATIGLAGTKNSYILFKNGQKIREIKEKDVFNEFKKELDLYKN